MERFRSRFPRLPMNRHPFPTPRSSATCATPSARSRWTRSRKRTRAILECRMGMAEVAYALWTRYLRHNPSNPKWAQPRPFHPVQRARLDAALRAAAPDRLRPADRRAREIPPAAQAAHRAIPKPPDPGCRNHDRTAWAGTGQRGWEMALAERLLAPSQSPPASRSSTITPTWWVGDGCLMEGIFARGGLARRDVEAGQTGSRSTTTTASRSTGKLRHWFTDDSALRFRAYQWDVIGPIDGHDPAGPPTSRLRRPSTRIGTHD